MKNKILYVIALAYFISGFQVFTTPDVSLTLLRQADPSITAHTDMFTLNQIGLIFMSSTALAAVLTWRGKVAWAYSLLTFLLSWWGLLYILSWIRTGYWQSLYGVVNYGLTAAILILCSKIVELPKGMQESWATPLPFEAIKAPEELKRLDDVVKKAETTE